MDRTDRVRLEYQSARPCMIIRIFLDDYSGPNPVSEHRGKDIVLFEAL
jgi:hypothetical protein